LKNGKEIGMKGGKNFIPIKLNSSDISEINQNPHESTKEKELELVENLTREIHDRYILREKVINEIKQVLKKHPDYTFKYKKEWPPKKKG
jgi:hypothetical protein